MPLPQPGDMFAGYRIVRALGSGGMGAVYLAEHPRLPRRDAIKVLDPGHGADPEFRARFEREAEIAARLEHPNVVAVYDRGEEGELLWIAMRFVDGVDASELVRRGRAELPPARAVRIVAAAARGLDAAHRRGLLHRDVKPANIMVSRADDGSDSVRIADFGIARPIGAATTTNSVLASFAYAAPEQFTGAPLDHRADVYALGCTLYELLTGSVPFVAPSPAAAMRAHLYERPPMPSDTAAELAVFDPVIARALAKVPRQRYGSCAELAQAALAALDELPRGETDRAGERSPNHAAASNFPNAPVAAPPTGSGSVPLTGPWSVPPTGPVDVSPGEVHRPALGARPAPARGGSHDAPVFGPAPVPGSHHAEHGSAFPGPRADPRSVPAPGPTYPRSAMPGGWSPPGSTHRTTRALMLGGCVLILIVSAVIATVLVRGAGETSVAAPVTGIGSPSTPSPSSTGTGTTAPRPTKADTTGPAPGSASVSPAWGPAAYIVEAFPGLLPTEPTGAGYQGMRCALNDDAGEWLHCPADTDDGINVNIRCDADRRPLIYRADTTGLAGLREENWARPSGSGKVRWASDSLAGFGLLDVSFDDPDRSFCVVSASGGSGGQDVYDRWWRSAPI